MVQEATDVPTGHIGKPAVAALVIEQRLAVLPQRLVAVHPRAVITEEWLGHESRGLAVCPGDIFDDVLEEHELVGSFLQ